jgi:hypothetical protein
MSDPGRTTDDRPMRIMALPLSPHAWATLTVALPLTEEEWDRLMAVLAAMRPGLVLATEGEAAFREIEGE